MNHEVEPDAVTVSFDGCLECKENFPVCQGSVLRAMVVYQAAEHCDQEGLFILLGMAEACRVT